MTPEQRDTLLVVKAAAVLVDGRDLEKDASKVLVTLESLVSLILLAVMDRNPAKAAAMLNEALVPGVEKRLALSASRSQNVNNP